MALKQLLSPIFFRVVDLFSSNIYDEATGECIGRALLLPWRGRIVMVGQGIAGYSLLPQFRPQKQLTFWKVDLGFTRHTEPDFPHEPRS